MKKLWNAPKIKPGEILYITSGWDKLQFIDAKTGKEIPTEDIIKKWGAYPIRSIKSKESQVKKRRMGDDRHRVKS